MPRSGQWWRGRASGVYFCTGCGWGGKCTSRCGTARWESQRSKQPHKEIEMRLDSQSPSSGDCGVTAERAFTNGDAQFETEMAAPVTELRTPTGTGANRSARVRMEAGRVGGGEVRVEAGGIAPPVGRRGQHH